VKEIRTYDEILAKRNEARAWLSNEGRNSLEETRKAMIIKAELLEWILRMR